MSSEPAAGEQGEDPEGPSTQPPSTEPGDADHSAVHHAWVIRTSAGDEMAATTRMATSWPLLRMYAIRQFHLRYRQSALGLGWTVVQPVAIMCIYGFVFNAILKVDPGDFDYLSMAWIGITVWMYVQASVQQGTISLLNDAWLIGRVWFPREVIPLAPVVASLIDLAVAGVILAGIVAVQGGGVVQGGGISVALVALPVIVVILVVWVAAISVITSAITIFFRDMATLVALTLRLLFIATPVMYPATTVPPEYGFVNAVNPFAVIVNSLRNVILAEVWPNWRLLLLHGAIGVVFFYGGLRYLRAIERRMVDII